MRRLRRVCASSSPRARRSRRGAARAARAAARPTSTPLVERAGVARRRPRAPRAAGRACPKGCHVQSNKPRDPTLIPTVLTIDAARRRHGRRDRLPAVDRSEAGRRRISRSPSSSATFAIGVAADASPSTVAPGDLVDSRAPALPGVRRRTCAIAPTTADVAVDAARRRRPAPAVAAAMPTSSRAIAFGHGDAPGGDRRARRRRAAAPRRPRPAVDDRPRAARRLHRARHDRRLPGQATSSCASSTTPRAA